MAKLMSPEQGSNSAKKSKVLLTDDRPPCGKHSEIDDVQNLSKCYKKYSMHPIDPICTIFKCHLISKGLFDVIISTKKQTNVF